jgi:CRP-like cAMP-binding protein
LFPLFFTTAITIALITGIGCLIVATSVDNLTNSRHDSVSELTALGVTNMVTPLFGGLPSSGSIGRVITNYNAGGKTKLSSIVSAILLLLFISHFSFIIDLIPFTAVAATLVIMAISLLDNWTTSLLQRAFSLKKSNINYSLFIELALVGLISLLMIFTSLTVAISVGVAIEFMLFLLSACQNLVRRIYHGDVFHSNHIRNTPAMDILAEDGRLIAVLELQGNLFFGTADYLYRLASKISDTVEIIIFDFRRIVDIDKSGVNILKQIDNFLSGKNKVLLLAYLPRNSDKYLQLNKMGFTKAIDEQRVFDDTNAALSNAEEIILVRRDPTLLHHYEIDLHDTIPLVNFDENEMAIMRNYLTHQTFCKNTCIIAEHDESNGMYILTLGRISVTKKIDDTKIVTLVSFDSGVSFGEMSLFSKEKRSADVYAGSDVRCYFLSLANFERLQLEHSELALKFISNIAASLSRRLFATSSVIRDFEN